MQYIGLVSEISDVTKKNQQDVDAYVKIASKYSGRILELGSGTGQLSVELAKQGHDVTCLEIHRDMIHLHREKLTEKTEENTKIVLGDMCSFDLKTKFDLIIAPDNVIQNIMTENEFSDMLQSVRKHLTDVGVFVIEAYQPQWGRLKLKSGIEKVNQYINPRNQNRIEERSKPVYNFDTLMMSEKKIITEYEEGRIKRRVEYLSEHKLWSKAMLIEMVEANHMSVILQSNQLDRIEPIRSDSEYMVFYIKR